jgi:hypothetical protein
MFWELSNGINNFWFGKSSPLVMPCQTFRNLFFGGSCSLGNIVPFSLGEIVPWGNLVPFSLGEKTTWKSWPLVVVFIITFSTWFLDLDKVYLVYFLIKHLGTSSSKEIALRGNLVLFSLKKLLFKGSCSTRQLRPLLLGGTWLGLPFDLLQGKAPFWFMYSQII